MSEKKKKQIYVLAGMPRTGTTFLYHNLQKHPDIYIPVRKELGYFSYNYDKGEDWYLSFFNEMEEQHKAFDITPMYFYNPDVIERIREFNPDAKILLGIRDPKEWIFSAYEQYREIIDIPPFSEFLEGCTIQREGKQVALNFNIKETIKNYMDAFGDNLLIYDFRILEKNSLDLLKAIEKFAGLPDYFSEENYTKSKINSRERKKMLFLQRFFFRHRQLVELVIKLFPKQFIMKVRNFIDELCVKNLEKSKTEKGEKKYSDREKQFVEEVFEKDSAFVKDLFKESPLVLGNGKPFSA